MRSIHAWIGSAGAGMRSTPPSLTRTTRSRSAADFVDEFFKQILPFKQTEILPQLLPAEGLAVRAQQGPDIVQVAGARWVIDVPLKLECNQPLGTDHPQPSHRRVPLIGGRQQLSGNGTMRVQQVETFLATQVVGRIRAAMDAVVPQFQQEFVQPVGIVGVDEKVDITGGANDIVGGKREPADQRRRGPQPGEGDEGFPDLGKQAGHPRIVARRVVPRRPAPGSRA